MNVVDRILHARHHYELLGVHRGSSAEDISRARRALAHYVHPDIYHEEGEDAHTLMARVNVAADTLLTNEKRYNASLRLKPCPACAGKGYSKKQKGFTAAVRTACQTCAGSGGVPR